MNIVFLLLIVVGYLTCVFNQWQWAGDSAGADPTDLAPMQILTDQMLTVANDAVMLAIGLIGVLALFLGLMRIAEEAGVIRVLSRLIYPLLKRLFPEIPANHPAFGTMVMNISANMAGLGNAATPFGLRAMQELEKLNPHPGVATNAMVLFLAINTSSVTLIPTKVIALRLSAGSLNPAGIITTTLLATIFSTIIAIIAAKTLQRFIKVPNNLPTAKKVTTSQRESHGELPKLEEADLDMSRAPYPTWVIILAVLGFLSLIPLSLIWGERFSAWIIPTLMVAIVCYGWFKKVEIYHSFVSGARGGFDIAIRIMPYLIAILVAIAMIRASGALGVFTDFVSPFTSQFGLPADALPFVLIRPLSGSGSLGVLSDLFATPHIGPDSYVGYLTSTMMGSTETTFYVLAVYFGSVQIKRLRHAVAVGLIADLAGIVGSILAVRWILLSSIN